MIDGAAMGKVDLPYVHVFKDRHGKARAYFRYQGKRWPLPSPDSPGFLTEYRRLKETLTNSSAVAVKGQSSLGWLIGQYQKSPEFNRLADSSKREYRKALSDIGLEHGVKSWRSLSKSGVIKHIRDPLAATPRKADAYVGIVASLYGWAITRDMISVNPAHNIPKLYQKSEGRRAWTAAEAETFCAQCSDIEYQIFALALYTGQRAGDLIKLTWFQYDGAAIRVTQNKTGRPLVLNCHPTLMALLGSMKRHDGTILLTAKGKPWDRPTLSAIFSGACRRMGLKGCTLHGLRSTHATWIAEKGGSEHEIGASTGHKSSNMIRRYTATANQERLAKQGISLLPDMKRTTSGKPSG